ncbi:MAG: hypothetical protein R3F59_00895 [Myxococcota bacterium]
MTKDELTVQTGSLDAADAFQAALDSVQVIGGQASVDPADAAVVDAVWATVRAELVARYSGGNRTLLPDAVLPQTVTVDNSYGIRTSGADGSITVGLGLPQNVPLMHIIMTHEALHSFDFAGGLYPVGTAIEGAASLTEHGAGWDILRASAPPAELPFWILSAVAGDARRYGISDGTLAVIQTDCPAGTDSAVIATDAAAAWGMQGGALAEVPVRSHFGTQFLSYLAGQYAYQDVVAWFDEQIEPGVDNGIDPFDLSSCGMTNPGRTQAEVDALRVCLGL